jgi:hypothetical protein
LFPAFPAGTTTAAFTAGTTAAAFLPGLPIGGLEERRRGAEWGARV